MSQVSQLNIYFVLPREDKGAKCSGDMDSAFTLVKRYKGKPEWVLPSFCLSHIPQSDDVFVFDDFKGEAFEKLKKDSAKILGAKCLQTTLSSGDVIPPGTSPIFTEGMRNLIVCSTGFDAATKRQIQERVEYMGGNYQNVLRSVVTHVVAHNNILPKAMEARKAGMTIMRLEWVEAVWKKSQQANVRGSDPEFNRYITPLFHNLKITTSGINKRNKDEIKDLVSRNGGIFTGQLEMNITDILVIEKAQGDKYNAAINWNVQCIKSSWVRACVEAGKVLPFNGHLLERPKASTPKKNEIVNFTGNFSTISAIEPERDFSRVEESANFTMSQSMMPPRANSGSVSVDNADLIDKILKVAPNAGNFLDGCNIFVHGFDSNLIEKLRRILNLAGATRFDELSSSVTHVLAANVQDRDQFVNTGAHILPLQWVLKSAEMLKPAPIENTFPLSGRRAVSKPTPASPLSKQGARLLQRTENQMPEEVADPEPAAEDELLHQYHLSQQGDPLEKMPAENLTPRPVSLSSTARSDALTQTNTELFYGLKFFLSRDLSEEELEGCETTITKYNGTVVSRKFSGVPDFAVVPIAGASLPEITPIEIVNVLFIKDCVLENRKMPIQYYHQTFPWVRGSSPLKGCVACVTKYAGVERDFVETLIETVGGVAQDILAKKQKNDILKTTHLICTEPSGNKYEGAVRWGVPVVHHNWLLKCAETGVRVPEEPYLITENKAAASTTKDATIVRKVQDPSKCHGEMENPVRLGNSTEKSAAAVVRTPIRQISQRSQRTHEISNMAPLAVSTKVVENYSSAACTPPAGIPSKMPLCEAAQSPINKALERLRNVETPKGSPSPDMNRTVTPNTPLGACFGNENPSPNTRKRLHRWMNLGANLPPDPPPKRFNKDQKESTPISELLSRQIRSMMRKPEDQPPDDSPEPAAKRLNFSISAEAESLANNVLNGLQKMKEIEDSYTKTNAAGPSPQTVTEEPKLVMVTESQPHTEIGWEDPTDREVALACLERAAAQIVEKPVKIFMFSGLTAFRDTAKEIIEASGGKVSTTQIYEKNATHLIAGTALSRGEKLMGSIAAGLWILHPSYLEELTKVKDVHAVKEEDFEWGNPQRKFSMDSLRQNVRDCVASAFHWRCDIQLYKKPRVFSNIKVALKISPSKCDIFQRLVEAGGGEIRSLESQSNMERIYCIFENAQLTEADLENFAKRNICCVNTMFISDLMLRKESAIADNMLSGFSQIWRRWQA